MRTCFWMKLTTLLFFAHECALADEPQDKEAEKIPAPKQKLEPQPFVPPPPQQVPGQPFVPLPQQQPLLPPHVPLPLNMSRSPRAGTREVWQNYAVDSFGRFTPRVILSPYGSYYLYNGQPYPWITNRSTAFMPYATD